MDTHVCMCAEKLETHSSSLFHLTYRVKASRSDPELATMASLPRHSVPKFGLHLPKLELQLGHHAHLAWCGLWRSNLWSYRLHDKCFTHWANTPPPPQATKLIFKVSKTTRHWQWSDLGYHLNRPGSVLRFQIQSAKWSVHSLWGSLSDGHLTVTLVPTFQK